MNEWMNEWVYWVSEWSRTNEWSHQLTFHTRDTTFTHQPQCKRFHKHRTIFVFLPSPLFPSPSKPPFSSHYITLHHTSLKWLRNKTSKVHTGEKKIKIVKRLVFLGFHTTEEVGPIYVQLGAGPIADGRTADCLQDHMSTGCGRCIRAVRRRCLTTGSVIQHIRIIPHRH